MIGKCIVSFLIKNNKQNIALNLIKDLKLKLDVSLGVDELLFNYKKYTENNDKLK